MPVTRIVNPNDEITTKPNARTRIEATQPDAMPMGFTSLIGTLLTPKGPAAYLKLSQGRVRRVQTGDIIDGARIVAIEDGELTLTRGSDTRAMRIPGH
ncbi:hypothetical protein TG4357_03554 [Thalassovita gelatinovora]|uniref:Type IV pilus biogenesis n=1 Tax=Thalassovita gelatinovora TaxID=53501 RepID=A0A0P1G517_THAGE|nr:hypothetical protein [Thalassovita gelatinovora]QIZ82344.1 hypothetical protein HFZ77_18610 [Thalassovita gelatinovora]CUH68411.1 hypothetical protein TG4357_03554 [Thalassovita gelatinovora]SEQ51401.1 hypothetical protein SAMN04488043_10615 [Thalassovita gelatinovora]